jgi:aryl-alcohol dehydrogenase-like predicted oxidoreductase
LVDIALEAGLNMFDSADVYSDGAAKEVLGKAIKGHRNQVIGCSNFSGWHLMKSLALSEKYGLSRYVAHQAYYSSVGRHYEWELMPLALDNDLDGDEDTVHQPRLSI